MSRSFGITVAVLTVIILAGVAAQPAYVSPEERRIADENKLLMIILEDVAGGIAHDQANNPGLYKSGITIVKTDDLEGLTVPDTVEGVDVTVVDEAPADDSAEPLYSTITINVYGSHGEVTVTHYWSFLGGTINSGLTLYCHRSANDWVVDYGGGWAP